MLLLKIYGLNDGTLQLRIVIVICAANSLLIVGLTKILEYRVDFKMGAVLISI